MWVNIPLLLCESVEAVCQVVPPSVDTSKRPESRLKNPLNSSTGSAFEPNPWPSKNWSHSTIASAAVVRLIAGEVKVPAVRTPVL